MFELFVEADAAASSRPSAAPVPALDARAAVEFAECSGAILAKLVADAMASLPDIPDTVAGDAQLLDLITATSRIDAWSESIRSTFIATLYQRTLAEHRRFGLVAQADGWGTAAGASHGFDDVALTRAEIAANLSLELGQSLPVADRAVTMALGLARTPVARQALGAGRMDPPQARSLMAELDHVPEPELRQDVAAALTTARSCRERTRSSSASCEGPASASGSCRRPRSGPLSGARWPSGSRLSPLSAAAGSGPIGTCGTTSCATAWPSWCCTDRPRC
jgi:hypothetical protein